MSYRHTIQAGLESLREIEQLLEEFSKGDSIPAVELDLVLQKTRNLYDIMLMLRQHQQEVTGQQPASQEPSAVEKSDAQQADSGSSTTEIPEMERDNEKTAAHRQQTVAEKTPMPEGSSAEKPPIPEGSSAEKSSLQGGSSAEKASVPEGSAAEKSAVPGGGSSGEKPSKPEKEASILSERYSGRSSLYDSIQNAVSDKNGEPIGQAKQVISIKSAIGINDRFTYIRELFNSDATVYENTIGILDEAANFNEAYNYMIQHFDWDMDSETVQQLLDIIRRKYITSRHE